MTHLPDLISAAGWPAPTCQRSPVGGPAMRPLKGASIAAQRSSRRPSVLRRRPQVADDPRTTAAHVVSGSSGRPLSARSDSRRCLATTASALPDPLRPREIGVRHDYGLCIPTTALHRWMIHANWTGDSTGCAEGSRSTASTISVARPSDLMCGTASSG